ncbi:MAG: response regulator transcription factor, partial [Caldilineaceae bacterium]
MDGMMNDAPTPICLLIADDNAATRAATVALLETGPHPVSVLHAGDGQAAVDLATQVDGDEVDVVLMDVQMPRLDGIAATRRIKQLRPGIRIIVLTMHAGHRDAALAAGADHFLLKGGPADTLLKVIFHSQGEAPCNRKGHST